MDFASLLNRYINDLGCSAKDLAEASGISAAAISRYRAGERTPDPDSKQLRMLAGGIAALSDEALDERAVLDDLARAISGIAVDYDTFLANLNALLAAMPVNNNELARALSFDPSYISRILAGQRRPADLQSFVTGVAGFVAKRHPRGASPESLQTLVGTDWGSISDDGERAEAIATWLGTNYAPLRSPISTFLEKLDAFDLDDYIRAIHFDEMKVPSAPLQLPTTKTYTGIRSMMDAEIDFLKATVLSKSAADVFMFSDMPMQEKAADPEFPKKWMYGMAMILKKGLHLRMVHCTNRPLPEMMLGLEGWIPMYMTGQISPYYFEDLNDNVFLHLMWVSGGGALWGEAVAGHHGEGRYVLTKNRDEMRYYRRRADRMLEKARPLMRIITAENADELTAFLEAEAQMGGRRRLIMSTLPISTVPEQLLERILERNGVAAAERAAIHALAARRRTQFDALLENGTVRLEVPRLAREEFDEHPAALELAGLFREEALPYTHDEYAEHLEVLRALAEEHPNCELIVDAGSPFRNTQIAVSEGRNALISKNKGPVIHFIVEHPAIVAALERFTVPMRE